MKPDDKPIFHKMMRTLQWKSVNATRLPTVGALFATRSEFRNSKTITNLWLLVGYEQLDIGPSTLENCGGAAHSV